jgi:hypothetical protein
VGGSYQRNFDYHTRTDNGGGINNAIVYLSGSTTNSNLNWTNSPYIPATVPSAQYSTYESYYDEALGIVTQPQVAYTRAGTNLALQPLGSSAFDKSIIPTYNEYVSDTWHVKPTFTLVYGLGYTIEMPPYELDGKQVVATDQSGQPLVAQQYFAEKASQALQGQSYDPYIGFAGVRTIGTGLKYPYNPVWNEFSPRIAFAWQPNYDSGILGKVIGHGKTVVRGGYGRIYGRLNGVGLVLTPLLGVGLIQAVTCAGPTISGTCGGATPANAWRAGTDGSTAPLSPPAPTLPQPFYPGIGGYATAGDAETLDPTYRPESTDNITLTIQREISRSSTIEVGYIGRKIRNEGQMLDIDAVPTMFTLNNQQYASAFANMYLTLCGNGPTCAGNAATSVAAQPFIESALGGPSSAYCSGYSNCTQALIANNKSLITGDQVSDLWLAMSKVASWTLGRTTASGPLTPGGSSALGQFTGEGLLASHGFGSYNAMFVTYRMREFHGVSLTSNFTWSRALGTAAISQSSSDYTALNPFNLQSNYGPQTFDIPLIFNIAAYYRPDVYKTQKGVVGHILGGWTISPLFTAQEGAPIGVAATEGSAANQAFGEVAYSGSSFGPETEEAVFSSKYTGGTSANYNVPGQTVNGTAVGTNNSTGVNMFSNPGAVYNEFRRCIVGYDTNCGGYGNLRNLPVWNLDAQALKDIGIWKEGRVGATLSLQVTNVLNHMEPGTPSLSLTSATTFGRITTQANTPRNMEIGIRVHF